MEPDDKELVRQFNDGDRTAYEKLVSRYKRKLYSVVYRMTRNHEMTDELLQETFIKLFTSADKYNESYPFYPWLHRIAVNTTINAIKKEKKRRYDKSLDQAKEDWNWSPADHSNPFDPEKAYKRKERDVKIVEALQQVSETYRTALLLRVFDGLSYKEIAETLNCTVGTVMSRLNRARTQMKKLLNDYMKNGTGTPKQNR